VAVGVVVLFVASRHQSGAPAAVGPGTSLERPAADGPLDPVTAIPPAGRPGGAEVDDADRAPGDASPLAAAGGSSYPSTTADPESFDAGPSSEDSSSFGQLDDPSAESDPGRDPSTEANAGALPSDPLIGGARIGRREPANAPATEVVEPSPDEPDPSSQAAPPTPTADQAEVLSPEEIQRRVEKILPDGSMPEDQLAAAREAEAKRILERSKIAAALTNNN
jgi:hypothetical protein